MYFSSQCVSDSLDSFFYRIGHFCGKHYKTAIALTLLFEVIMEVCIVQFQELENRPENLWVAQNTASRTDYQYVEDVWGATGSWIDFVLIQPKAGKESLTADSMQDLLRLHNELLAINVSVNDDRFPGLWDFNRKCTRTGEVCSRTTVLDIFNQMNETLIANLEDPTVVSAANDLSKYVSDADIPFARSRVLGGLTSDGEGNAYTNAQAVLTTFAFDQNEVYDDGGRLDPVQDEWEAKAIDVLDAFDSNEFDVLYYLARSLRDDFQKLLMSDIVKIATTYVIIVVYAAINLGKRHGVRSGVGLAFASVVSVGLAYRCSYGMAAIFGFKVTPLHNVILFLLLALGIDDAFVICSKYWHLLDSMREVDLSDMDVADLLGQTIMHAGQSIMLTSFTDFFVFMLGATTVLPALSSFCIYAGLGVLFDFIFQITFFTACISINHIRMQSKRRDCFCCFKKQVDSENERCCFVCPAEHPSMLSVLFQSITRSITKGVAIVVVVISLAAGALGIYGLAIRETEFDLIWFLEDGAQSHRFITAQREFFNAPEPVGVYVKDIDYYANQVEMGALHEAVVSSEYFDSTWGVLDWHDAYLAHARSELPPSQLSNTSFQTIVGEDLYYDTLRTWLQEEGAIYAQYILWKDDDSSRILSSKIDANFAGEYVQEEGVKRYKAMNSLRDEITGVAPTSFAFGFYFVFWEEFGIIRKELTRNVIIAVIVIIITVFSLIQDKRSAVCTIASILLAVIDVAGLVTFWGETYNGVTTIYTLIALGLSVDYSIHIGHKFSKTGGQIEDRLSETMVTMGPPVMHGAMSTFLAVLVLADAKSYIFSVFFKMFVLVGTLGALHGLYVLPCFLFLFGGDGASGKDARDDIEISKIPTTI